MDAMVRRHAPKTPPRSPYASVMRYSLTPTLTIQQRSLDSTCTCKVKRSSWRHDGCAATNRNTATLSARLLQACFWPRLCLACIGCGRLARALCLPRIRRVSRLPFAYVRLMHALCRPKEIPGPQGREVAAQLEETKLGSPRAWQILNGMPDLPSREVAAPLEESQLVIAHPVHGQHAHVADKGQQHPVPVILSSIWAHLIRDIQEFLSNTPVETRIGSFRPKLLTPGSELNTYCVKHGKSM
eukprot:2301169-Pleurochrysis_carterae.AAC.5